MISSDAGVTSSTISSPTEPSPMPMLSPTPSLTLSPVSTTSDNSNHRPFAGGLLSARQQTVKPRRKRLALIRIFEELSPGHEGSYDAVPRYSKLLLIMIRR